MKNVFSSVLFFFAGVPALACSISISGTALNSTPDFVTYDGTSGVTFTGTGCTPTGGGTIKYGWSISWSDGSTSFGEVNSKSVSFGASMPFPDRYTVNMTAREEGPSCATNTCMVASASKQYGAARTLSSVTGTFGECTYSESFGRSSILSLNAADPDPPTEITNRPMIYTGTLSSGGGVAVTTNPDGTGTATVGLPPRLDRTYTAQIDASNFSVHPQALNGGVSSNVVSTSVSVTCDPVAPFLRSFTSSANDNTGVTTATVRAYDPDFETSVTAVVSPTANPLHIKILVTPNSPNLIKDPNQLDFVGTYQILASHTGTYNMEITLTDGNGMSRTYTRQAFVHNSYFPPTAVVTPGGVVKKVFDPDETLTYSGGASVAAEGHQITEFAWDIVSAPGEYHSNPMTGSDVNFRLTDFSGKPKPGVYRFRLRVTDDEGGSSSTEFQVLFNAQCSADGTTCIEDVSPENAGKPANGPCVKPGGCPLPMKQDITKVGKPVVVSTGAMWHQMADFELAGKNARSGINFYRTYTANAATFAGDFGPNWRHSYETRLDSGTSASFDFLRRRRKKNLFSVQDVIWIDENGGPWIFVKNGNFTYSAPKGLGATLQKSGSGFILTKHDRTKLYFSGEIGTTPQGTLFKIVEPHGETLDFGYENEQLATITSSITGTVRLVRNSEGRVSEVVRERDNLHYFYTYNAEGRLATSSDFAGVTHHYDYVSNMPGTSAQGMLTKIRDPLNRELVFEYYPDGKAKNQFEPGGGTWQFRYGKGKTQVKGPDGGTNTYFFDENLQPIKQVIEDGTRLYSKWNADGQLEALSVELEGFTRYAFDANSNITEIQRPLDKNPIRITYDQVHNKPTLVEPLAGASTAYTIDPVTGDITQESRNGLSLIYTRDAYGNILCTDNGRANYCNQRNGNGLLSTVFDTRNPETRTYDTRNRLSTRTFASGRSLSYTYDDYDRVTHVVDSHGPDSQNVYDVMGRVLQRIVTDGTSNQVTTYTYDDKDRITTVTDAMNRTTTFAYDPVRVHDKPIAITDPANRTTYFAYDKRVRLIKKTDAKGAETKFTYDARNNLTSVTDANGNVTTYAYDLNNRKIRESRPSVAGTAAATRVTEYFYDAGDRLIKERTLSTRKGYAREILYTYDNLDRVIRKVLQRQEGASVIVEDDSSYSYASQLDVATLASANNQVANLGFESEAAPPFAISSYTVNAAQSGNPLGLIEGNYAVARHITGEINGVSRNSAEIFTKDYDPAARLIQASSGSFETELGYDGFGRKTTVSHADGTNGTYTYDLLNRITNVNWTGGSTGATPISQQLTYNLAGNVEQMTRENGTYTLGYDDVDQLISSATTGAANYNRSWTLDLLGNRLQDSINGTGTFLANFLLGNSQSSFQADGEGFGETARETTGSIVKNYIYRADGKISGFQSGSLSVGYHYDGLDRLVAKTISDGSSYTQTFMHLAGENRVLLGKSGDGSVTTYLDGLGVVERLGEVKNGVGKAYLIDHLGSVLNSSVAGNSNVYGLFGELASNPGISQASSPVVYGFTGHMVDLESGLTRTEYRQYDPKIGRWLTQEPLGLDGPNLYTYVSNSPLNMIDPDGLSERDVQEIIERAQRLQTQLTENNLRTSPGPWNNFSSTLNTLSLGLLRYPYLGCGEQAGYVKERLPGKLDDLWSYIDRESMTLGFKHQWFEGRSSNPSDPKVTIDPWKNKIVIVAP